MYESANRFLEQGDKDFVLIYHEYAGDPAAKPAGDLEAVAVLSAADRKKLRGEKFGMSDDDKKKKRAERFGLAASSDDEEKKLKRRQRFGNTTKDDEKVGALASAPPGQLRLGGCSVRDHCGRSGCAEQGDSAQGRPWHCNRSRTTPQRSQLCSGGRRVFRGRASRFGPRNLKARGPVNRQAALLAKKAELMDPEKLKARAERFGAVKPLVGLSDTDKKKVRRRPAAYILQTQAPAKADPRPRKAGQHAATAVAAAAVRRWGGAARQGPHPGLLSVAHPPRTPRSAPTHRRAPPALAHSEGR
jgi:hypothetical protein